MLPAFYHHKYTCSRAHIFGSTYANTGTIQRRLGWNESEYLKEFKRGTENREDNMSQMLGLIFLSGVN